MAEIIQTTQSSKKASKNPPPRLNWQLYGLSILAVIILAGGGWLIYKHFKPTFTNYSLKSQQSGSGMAFDRPAKDSKVLYSQTGQVELADSTTAHKVDSVIAAAITSTSKAPYTASQLKSLSTIFSDIKNSLYIQYFGPLSKFVSARVAANTPLMYTALRPFTNPNIKENAWQMTFTGLDSTGKVAQIKGKIIYAITNHGYYYYMFYTSFATWSSSQKTWTHVLNSLKLDQ